MAVLALLAAARDGTSIVERESDPRFIATRDGEEWECNEWRSDGSARVRARRSQIQMARTHHRTLPPNIPGDIQGILAIYTKYTANIRNIPQISPNRFRLGMTHLLLWSPDVCASSDLSKFLQVVLPLSPPLCQHCCTIPPHLKY